MDDDDDECMDFDREHKYKRPEDVDDDREDSIESDDDEFVDAAYGR